MATWLASRVCWVGAGHDLAARHDGPSQMMPCGRVAIAASRGPASSEARLRGVSGGKPVDAATSTHAHRHLLMTIDIDGPNVQGAAGSEAELQLGSFCHSQHAFDAHAVWLLKAPLDGSAICSRRELRQCRGELHLTCVMHKSPCCPNLSRMLFYVALRRIVY